MRKLGDLFIHRLEKRDLNPFPPGAARVSGGTATGGRAEPLVGPKVNVLRLCRSEKCSF
jgi:hypothetical protein